MLKRSYQFGGYRLDPHRQLHAGRQSVVLGRKALELLSVLAEAEGDLVTKDELLTAVWPDATVEENTLQAHIVALRRALGEEADRLVTVRSLGYRFAPETAPETAANGVSARSVAILPFLNLTGAARFDFLGDSITEELNNRLSHEPGIKVIASTTCFAYRGQCRDVREIAGELGVGSVVEGSVRQSGERVRITAQLIEAATGFHRWSENYDRDMTDLLVLEDEVAGSIAGTIAAMLPE